MEKANKQKKKMPSGAKVALITVSIVLTIIILATVMYGSILGIFGLLIGVDVLITVGVIMAFLRRDSQDDEYEDESNGDEIVTFPNSEKINESFDDIYNLLNDLNLSEDDKQNLEWEIKDHERAFGEIIRNVSLTNEEKTQLINEILKRKQQELHMEVTNDNKSQQEIANGFINNYLVDSGDETAREIGEAIASLGTALKDGNQASIVRAMDNLNNIILSKDSSVNDILADAIYDAIIYCETLSDIKVSLYVLSEDLRNDVKDAIPKAKAGILNALIEMQAKEEIATVLANLRKDLVGYCQKEIEDMYFETREIIDNSTLTGSLKDELADFLNDAKEKLDSMLKEGADDLEIIAEIEEIKSVIDEELNYAIEDTVNLSRPCDENEIANAINQAIENSDREILSDIFDVLEEELKNPENGEWLQGDALEGQLGNMAKRFQDIADIMPNGEAKDIWQAAADAFEDAEQSAQQGDDQKAIDKATRAIDNLEQRFWSFIDNLARMQQIREYLSDRFEQAQDSISNP